MHRGFPKTRYATLLTLTMLVSFPIAVGIVPVVGAAGGIGCNSIITTSTVLKHDIGPCKRFGLFIGADNVTLNCDGHTIIGAASNHVGIGSSASLSGDTIKNCNVTNFFFGFSFNGPLRNSTLTGNTERGGTFGFSIAGSDIVLRNNSASSGSADGFSLFLSDSKVIENSAHGFSQYGFDIENGANNLFRNNTATSAFEGFLIFDSNDNFVRNVANGNSYGFSVGCCVSGNTLQRNQADVNQIGGYHDISGGKSNTGSGTAGTNDYYKGNECSVNGYGSNPSGLCTPQS